MTTVPALSFGFFEGNPLGAPVLSIEEGDYRAAAWEPLPPSVDARITSDEGKAIIRSWKNWGPPKTDFAYVQLIHLSQDGKNKVGELVLHKDLAFDIVRVAWTAFGARFPITSMRLIDYWDADDNRSMSDDNSSALCVRQITGGGKMSLHSLGRAVDINTRINPYRKYRPGEPDIVEPEAGRGYLDRTQTVPGILRNGDAVVQAFRNLGWTWGGEWENPIDYQHFQKPAIQPS